MPPVRSFDTVNHTVSAPPTHRLCSCTSKNGAQIVVLTPYLAQLMELRDALDGTISDQDASELAVAIKQGGDGGGGGPGGDGRSGKQGNRQQNGPANNGGKTGSSGRTSGPDSRPKVRVSTGE